MRVVGDIGGLGRKGRRRQFAPRAGAVAAPQLGAEMPEVERRIERLAVLQHRGHRIAEKMRRGDVPAAVFGRQFEETLAGPDIEALRHPLLPYPPVNAWKT